MKKILIIGANGDLGSAIVNELKSDSEIIQASQHQSDVKVDLASSDSIKAMYKKIGKLDAVICAAARGVVFAPLTEMDIEKITQSMQSKLLGQINLVLLGLNHLNQHSSFTLTTGLLNADPIAKGAAAAMVNSAVEGFVKAAAIDMPNNLRINAVSPALLTESAARYSEYFPGYDTVPAKKAALAYRKSVYGQQTGEVYRVGW